MTQPPSNTGLTRFGLQWNGPQNFVATPMSDGYWTPWHEAQDEITRLQHLLQEWQGVQAALEEEAYRGITVSHVRRLEELAARTACVVNSEQGTPEPSTPNKEVPEPKTRRDRTSGERVTKTVTPDTILLRLLQQYAAGKTPRCSLKNFEKVRRLFPGMFQLESRDGADMRAGYVLTNLHDKDDSLQRVSAWLEARGLAVLSRERRRPGTRIPR